MTDIDIKVDKAGAVWWKSPTMLSICAAVIFGTSFYWKVDGGFEDMAEDYGEMKQGLGDLRADVQRLAVSFVRTPQADNWIDRWRDNVSMWRIRLKELNPTLNVPELPVPDLPK